MLRGAEANGAWACYQFEELGSDSHGASTNLILFVLPLILAGLSAAGQVSPSNP